jgi:1-phosphofructokinase family hexose kinase
VILTVTLNPALDLTYQVEALVAHTTHRVREVAEHPGGKGLNVARVLHALGEPVLATGLLGGATGNRVGELIDRSGLPASFVPIGAGTRRTVAVVDTGNATNFSEPGPAVAAGEWEAFQEHYDRQLGAATVAVLSGSLPPGLPTGAYATLVAMARARGVRVILDASGTALRLGARARPDLVKPNESELAALGPPERVLALGPRAAVVSRGAAGLLAVTGAGRWQAAPPERVRGNPTGAGDACVAALARGLRDGAGWPELLADAVALSAAAVAAPVAGAADLATYRRLRSRVVVTPC